MLVLQSLASSHVSMVIVAGDPFTATNSKKRKEKKPQVLIFLCIFHRLFLREALPCCISVTSPFYCTGPLFLEGGSQSRVERDAQAGGGAARVAVPPVLIFPQWSATPWGLVLQPLHKNTRPRAASPSCFPPAHTLQLLRAKVKQI